MEVFPFDPLMGTTSDFKSAYRQATANPNHARGWVVAMWDAEAKKPCFRLVGYPIHERCLVRPLPPIFQNLHSPQVRQNFPLWCFVTCSCSVPNSSGWNISAFAEEARGEEADDEEDESTDDEREDGGVEGCGGVQGGGRP